MIEGILTVNLDPPYCSFHSHTTGFNYLRSAECTVDEIRAILLELGAISSGQNWPMKECFVRLTGKFFRGAVSRAWFVADASASARSCSANYISAQNSRVSLLS